MNWETRHKSSWSHTVRLSSDVAWDTRERMRGGEVPSCRLVEVFRCCSRSTVTKCGGIKAEVPLPHHPPFDHRPEENPHADTLVRDTCLLPRAERYFSPSASLSRSLSICVPRRQYRCRCDRGYKRDAHAMDNATVSPV